ncbi:CTP-dependent riboflavin kinase [Candidatus Nitrosopelagicus sp.]|nr:CTP-dependent riboflavin kinase [Candidatus Nitrosopelagicus sp.]
MADLKTQHLLTLAHILSKGGKHNFVNITTTSLGKEIGKSQQSASLHLKELELGGFIERIQSGRKQSIKITNKGFIELSTLNNLLSKLISKSPNSLTFTGTITSGMGEGAYYMSMKGYTKQFKSKLGYIPYPGTLNVQIKEKKFSEAISQLSNYEGTKISPFSDGKRTFGWVKCFKSKINNKIDCELILLERTHHDTTIVEFISKHNIRKALKISDKSNIKVKISILDNFS